MAQEKHLSRVSGWPQAAANIRPEIAGEAADFSNVGIRLGNGLLEVESEPDDVSDAVPGAAQHTIAVADNFIPPNVTIERFGYFDRQLRATDLNIRISIAGQSDGASVWTGVEESQLQRLILSGEKQCLQRFLEHAQQHRPGCDADPDIVLNDVPLVPTPHGSDLDWAMIVHLAEPGPQRMQ